jgi:hypothetical protein
MSPDAEAFCRVHELHYQTKARAVTPLVLLPLKLEHDIVGGLQLPKVLKNMI